MNILVEKNQELHMLRFISVINEASKLLLKLLSILFIESNFENSNFNHFHSLLLKYIGPL